VDGIFSFMTFSLRHCRKLHGLHNDADFADQCEREAEHWKENVDKYGLWEMENGNKRAWFDDGTPLGTSEC